MRSGFEAVHVISWGLSMHAVMYGHQSRADYLVVSALPAEYLWVLAFGRQRRAEHRSASSGPLTLGSPPQDIDGLARHRAIVFYSRLARAERPCTAGLCWLRPQRREVGACIEGGAVHRRIARLSIILAGMTLTMAIFTSLRKYSEIV